MSLRVVALAIAVLALLPPASAAGREGKQYKVGGPGGWVVPPPEAKETYYANWASKITFYVKDSLEFVYRNDSVIPVDKAGYYHCTGGTPRARLRDGVKTVRLDAPGNAYFASADADRCKMGARLMINVLPAPSTNASHATIVAPSVPAMAVLAVALALAM